MWREHIIVQLLYAYTFKKTVLVLILFINIILNQPFLES